MRLAGRVVSRPASKVPPTWGSPPNFVFGNRETFKDYAASDALPRWLRVVYGAYGNMQANGHANFAPGDLAGLLSETVDGVRVPAARQRVHEAIHQAKVRGLLMPESKARCLVVPPEAVAYGKGNVTAACPLHKRNEESVSSASKTTRYLQVISTPDERQNRVVSRSAPSPLSISATEDHGEALA